MGRLHITGVLVDQRLEFRKENLMTKREELIRAIGDVLKRKGLDAATVDKVTERAVKEGKPVASDKGYDEAIKRAKAL